MSGQNLRLHLVWPWQDRRDRFSWLKATSFALMFAPAAWLLWQVEAERFGRVPLAGMTYWSGVWATALLLLALAVTPAATLFRWPRLTIVRRMIGVTALAYTIAHIIVYFALRFWDFGYIANEMLTRLTLIVATVSTLGIAALGLTSLDAAIQYMGPKRWNRLHKTVYAITGLAMLHYLLSPGVYAAQYLMTGMFLWLMLWRVLNRHGLGRDVRALTGLAVATALFTALFEAAWTWAYHDFEPTWTLRNNFRLEFGISPAWHVLVLGQLIALASQFRRAPHVAPSEAK